MDGNHHPQGEPIAWIADPPVDIATADVFAKNISTHDIGDDIGNDVDANKDVAGEDMGDKGLAGGIVGSGSELAHGRWGRPDQLALPLSDRGLQLADGLFETLLVEEGQPLLLKQHLERWRTSAALLGMATPPGAEALRPRIAEAVRRSGIRQGALRLNWSRGSGGRGLDLPAAEDPQPIHRFWLQLSACQPAFGPLTTIISRHERRNAYSQVSHCKTFAYGGQIQARREARAAGAEEALLLNSEGELCCGSAANLLVRRSGRWLTPPASSGCLPGVMRRQALETALAAEASLSPDDLFSSEGALLINSLGCRPLRRCEGQELPSLEPSTAEALWRSLLDRAEL
jgi:branched-subunit amino acid aminotransferase/4-amino-4-deoxychorismate lyase